MVRVWQAEDFLQELVLCFYLGGPGDQNQFIRLGIRHLHLLCPSLLVGGLWASISLGTRSVLILF